MDLFFYSSQILVERMSRYPDIEFELEEFLKDNYRILNVMGIFGGISVLFATFSNSLTGFQNTLANLGIVSANVIFLLLSRIVSKNFTDQFNSYVSIYMFIFGEDNIYFSIFILLYHILISVVLIFSFSFVNSFSFILYTMLLLVLPYIFLRINFDIPTRLASFRNDVITRDVFRCFGSFISAGLGAYLLKGIANLTILPREYRLVSLTILIIWLAISAFAFLAHSYFLIKDINKLIFDTD